jgi:sugar lactone lactonase YvrE
MGRATPGSSYRRGMTLPARALALLAGAATTAALVVPAAPSGAAPVSVERQAPPDSIALPDGFQPEGIAVRGRYGFFGSLADGDVYRADLRTGRGRVVSQGPGTPAAGIKVGPRDRLYVSGGDSGTIRLVSLRTGRTLRTLRPRGAGFVNDVVLAPRAAYFTDSLRPRVYRVPIRRDGRLPRTGDVRTIRLRGAWEQPAEGGLGANGITRAPGGGALLVVDTTAGTLFRVPALGRRAGVAERVRLGGASLTNGDGMLLEGRRLYVVRNQLNRVEILRLNATGTRGTQDASFSDSGFDVPTTIARWRGALYLPNARFTTPPTPTTTYTVTRTRG